MFQHAPDHNTFEELEDMAQNRRFWRSLVVAIEPEATLKLSTKKEEGEENKKLRSHKRNGS